MWDAKKNSNYRSHEGGNSIEQVSSRNVAKTLTTNKAGEVTLFQPETERLPDFGQQNFVVGNANMFDLGHPRDDLSMNERHDPP